MTITLGTTTTELRHRIRRPRHNEPRTISSATLSSTAGSMPASAARPGSTTIHVPPVSTTISVFTPFGPISTSTTMRAAPSMMSSGG